MKKFTLIITMLATLISTTAIAAESKKPRIKFYDFSEQLIDGEIKKPQTLFMNSRQAVKFGRLLKLKKSFLPKLYLTAKELVFK